MGTYLHISDGSDGVRIWGAAADILTKQSVSRDPQSSWLGERLTIFAVNFNYFRAVIR
jgi:hypothetical protein